LALGTRDLPADQQLIFLKWRGSNALAKTKLENPPAASPGVVRSPKLVKPLTAFEAHIGALNYCNHIFHHSSVGSRYQQRRCVQSKGASL
jgi:hypothetical protein